MAKPMYGCRGLCVSAGGGGAPSFFFSNRATAAGVEFSCCCCAFWLAASQPMCGVCAGWAADARQPWALVSWWRRAGGPWLGFGWCRFFVVACHHVGFCHSPHQIGSWFTVLAPSWLKHRVLWAGRWPRDTRVSAGCCIAFRLLSERTDWVWPWARSSCFWLLWLVG